jgi:hypothetical protein
MPSEKLIRKSGTSWIGASNLTFYTSDTRLSYIHLEMSSVHHTIYCIKSAIGTYYRYFIGYLSQIFIDFAQNNQHNRYYGGNTNLDVIAYSEPDYLHIYKGHSSIATISFIVLVVIGINAKIMNIYHRHPNKIFIMGPIMAIPVLAYNTLHTKCILISYKTWYSRLYVLIV